MKQLTIEIFLSIITGRGNDSPWLKETWNDETSEGYQTSTT